MTADTPAGWLVVGDLAAPARNLFHACSLQKSAVDTSHAEGVQGHASSFGGGGNTDRDRPRERWEQIVVPNEQTLRTLHTFLQWHAASDRLCPGPEQRQDTDSQLTHPAKAEIAHFSLPCSACCISTSLFGPRHVIRECRQCVLACPRVDSIAVEHS